MPNAECLSGGHYLRGPVHEAIEGLMEHIVRLQKSGYTNLEFEPDDDDAIAIWGKRPASPEEIEAARQKRLKQYERLKKEFG